MENKTEVSLVFSGSGKEIKPIIPRLPQNVPELFLYFLQHLHSFSDGLCHSSKEAFISFLSK